MHPKNLAKLASHAQYKEIQLVQIIGPKQWRRCPDQEQIGLAAEKSGGKVQFLTINRRMTDERISMLVEVFQSREKDPGNKDKYDKLERLIRNPKTTDAQLTAYLHKEKQSEKEIDKKFESFRDDGIKDLLEWNKVCSEKIVFQPNECSRLHKMLECIDLAFKSRRGEGSLLINYPDLVETFVVRHNWLLAFGDSLGEVRQAEIKLPYPITAFEFRVCSRTLIVVVFDRDIKTEEESKLWYYFAEAKNGFWVAYEDKLGTYPVMRWAKKQVEAICVMLDSQVAEFSTTKQPVKLQEKRQRDGKLPLYDYHIVDLSKQHKNSKVDSTPTGRKVRCHWRRGHWLHADKQPFVDLHRTDDNKRWEQYGDCWRTWIKWMLVGDPDLGFVDKEYRL